MDMATMGQPGKYTFCFAENEQASLWEPFHVSRGYDRKQSTVTVVGATGTVEVKDESSTDADRLLTTLARVILGAGGMSSLGLPGGANPLLLLAPNHARIIAQGKTREAAQAFLRENACLPLRTPSASSVQRRRRIDFREKGNAELRVAERGADILLVVVGGRGFKSTYVPTWGGSHAITRVISDA
jgi:hypothetical protein